mgnify:CR=1 FL=1
MKRVHKSKCYESIPGIYDYIMKKISYSEWADYIHETVKDSIPVNAKVLELAAGNCKFANHFKKYYPDLITTDISKNMLFFDKENKVCKVCADMVYLPFKEKFDLIYSNFDSINYITSKKILLKLFKGVFSILPDNGIFTFDVCLEKNSLKHSKTAIRKGIYNGTSFIQKSEYNRINRIHKNTFIIKTDNNSEIMEIHKQKIYPFENYFELCNKAGLYIFKCFNAFSFHEGNRNSERVLFLTKGIGKHALL